MLNFAICEISGKQYKVIPGQPLEVALQKGSDQEIVVNVLLLSEDSKLKIGNPYLKEKLTLKRLEDGKGEKIRVSKFHAKANYRRTTGYRSKITKVVLEKKS
ncbi:MAG: 50S ribosomal protein L21 [Candidatus Daviesbacteria bacterium]|nr:50S ribosomal protein L21 [Candidatus Daviesbacteria bacterium]